MIDAGVDAVAVGRAPIELTDEHGRTTIDLDIDVHQGDRAGGNAGVLVGIGPGPVEREDAVAVRRRGQAAELDDGNGPQEYDGLLARMCVTGGFRSGTLVLASIAVLLLLSVLPAASWATLWKA